MNCTKCGHPADHHGYEGSMYPHKPDEIGDEYECLCNMTQEEIERNAWKAEALAAREYIKMLEKYMGGFFGDEISITVDEMDNELEAYRTEKVKDAQP